MSTPDDTYYSLNRLHCWFAAAAMALLGATVWMIVADHRRPWKVFQRTFRDRIEPWTTEAAMREHETEAFFRREEELRRALEEAEQAVPDRALLDRFCEELRRDAEARRVPAPDVASIEQAYQALVSEPSRAARQQLLAELNRFVRAAQTRLDRAEQSLRFARAEFDALRTRFEAAVGAAAPADRLEVWRAELGRAQARVAEVQSERDVAASHFQVLSRVLEEMVLAEQQSRDALARHLAQRDRLDRTLATQRPSVAKWLLSQPLIDAWGRPLAIEQIGLPDLPIPYPFQPVARFDRCTTCHQGIDRTVVGSATQPAYVRRQMISIQLETPANAPLLGSDDPAARADAMRTAYGFSLAPHGILDDQAPTVAFVAPQSAAARAGLMAGDVIMAVGGHPVTGRYAVERLLLRSVDWGKRLTMEIERGLPHPYASHPRLELFVGSESPHPSSTFGCTICHDGQGSATDFGFASHSPNDPEHRARWRRQYGWFWNVHWDWPMRPKRFVESNCLKCHHDVTDLEPSARFPDPPAPKLLAGYRLVRRLGCFGCHEIRGVKESGERIGPDLRLEPAYAEAAQGLAADPAWKHHAIELAQETTRHPENPEPRRQLVSQMRAASTTALDPSRRRLVDLLAAEPAAPGTLRKVGPSLRHVATKLEAAVIAQWIADPGRLRPDTRMPQLLGMHEHLDASSRKTAERFEAVELRAMTEYLLAMSQPVALATAPSGITEAPSADRGKRLFQRQGCLACHRHAEFPGAQSTQGPDLSRLGSKLRGRAGALWLTGWIRDPSRYSARTIMPAGLLDAVGESAESGRPDRESAGASGGARSATATARRTDPAADVAAYLLSSVGEQPQPLPTLVDADLDTLARLYLTQWFPQPLASEYLRQGIPQSATAGIPADAWELVGPIDRQKKLRFVGRRTIRRRGCFGCHDIPGLEDAQAIGPALSDWGRKPESQLAFEQVHRFLAESDGQAAAPSGGPPPLEQIHGLLVKSNHSDRVSVPHDRSAPLPNRLPGSAAQTAFSPSDEAFYHQAILAKRREGFAWQKLRAPRSFDYQKTAHKSYIEQLVMGRFALTDSDREAIVTFLLGLVAEPPSARYVFQPSPRTKAVIEGRKVLDQYGCAECHTLELERWTIQYDPARFPPPPVAAEFDFLKPQVTAQQLAASQQVDRRGMARAELVGMPQFDSEGNLAETEDDEGRVQYGFTLWEPAVLGGKVWPAGGASVLVGAEQVVARRLPQGGQFARLLYPVVLAEAKAAGRTAPMMEAWGWVPPALVHEGRRVQPGWLYEYLLDPRVVRPAVALRMPRFPLSVAEARCLTDYFAAISGAEFPYISDPRARSVQLLPENPQQAGRLDRALRFLVDRTTYCAKCHLVGDSGPGGPTQTVLAPQLDRVGRRIRPEFLRRWLANPRSILPYTAMPVNFPPDRQMGQDLYRGSSLEQLDAVMDLLLCYDEYLKRRVPIRALIGPNRAD